MGERPYTPIGELPYETNVEAHFVKKDTLDLKGRAFVKISIRDNTTKRFSPSFWEANWNWWRGKEINALNILKVGAVAFLVSFVLGVISVAYLTYSTYTSFG